MQLQRLVDRDADMLVTGLEQLEVVIGFDGAANFVHVLMRLIDYLPGMAKARHHISTLPIATTSIT